MRLAQYTLPRAEPISLTEAKLHLRLAVDATEAATYTDEDELLTVIIGAARMAAEVETWKKCVLQTYDLYLDNWPIDKNYIELPWSPVRSVEFVKYTDSAGTVNTWATTEYNVDVDSVPGRVQLAYDKIYPSATLDTTNPIHIRFRCGYLVPFTADADTNTLTAIDHPFSDGNKIRLSVSGGSLPTGLSALTDYYVVDTSGSSFSVAATLGGDAVAFTTDGSGSMFAGELPKSTIAGIKLVIADLYEERADTVVGKTASAIPGMLPRGAKQLFSMDTARKFY